MEKYNQNKEENISQEIDIKDFVLFVWSKKYLVSVITFSFLVLFIIYSIFLPNTYTSFAMLAPVNTDTNLTKRLNSFSSLASFAGISLPAESINKSREGIERLQSYDFFVNEFLPKVNLEDLMAAKSWDKVNNILTYDDDIFNINEKKWVRDVSLPKLPKPSDQEAFREFQKIFTVVEDDKTLYASLYIDHISAEIAKEWLEIIVQSINENMRNEDIKVASSSIDYLSELSGDTNLSDVKAALSKLLEEQMQILMLTNVRDEYIFKTISSPLAPENPSGPNRLFIWFIGIFLGLASSIAICLNQYRKI